MPVYTSQSTWSGSLNDGSGRVLVESGVIDIPVAESPRKSEATNPEEILGGALASCYNLRLAKIFETAHIVPSTIDTTVVVDLKTNGPTSRITKIGLDVDVQAQKLDQERLESFAERALAECPVAKSLGETEISLAVKLKT